MFGTKVDMQQQAAERVEDLKERGFAHAGLYDPAGVGGTHVMYVLHHADQPSLYHGLPDDPRISPMVRIWKGLAKPIALAGLALAALGGFFHYTRIGPNEVSIDDELDARDEVTRIRAREAERRREAGLDTGTDEEHNDA
jgi:formate dehydrogenase iron-sulfur subunit